MNSLRLYGVTVFDKTPSSYQINIFVPPPPPLSVLNKEIVFFVFSFSLFLKKKKNACGLKILGEG